MSISATKTRNIHVDRKIASNHLQNMYVKKHKFDIFK